jgi:hypothetical protein
MRSVLLGLVVFFSGVFLAATPAGAAPCQPAELFVAVTGDPVSEIQADVTLTLIGATPTGSTPLDGVYWSNGLQQNSYQRSREFHLCVADEPTLHAAAQALLGQFHQESVLSFSYLPQHTTGTNAILITVPDVDITRFGAALLADPTARDHVRGGSVTTTDHTLILVAGNDDAEVARRLVGEAGGNWNAATIAYGRREFVE